LITDPVVVNNEDGDVATMGEENEQRGGGGGGGGGGDGAGQQPGPVTTILYLKTQYVWGPGDSPTAGVDELLMQQDTDGKQWYPLQDAQGDVVSLIHMPLGAGATQAEVAGQWTYSPYGEVLTYEQFHPHPVVVFGHKSLVVDRLDTQAVSWDTDLGTISDTQRLIPGAKLISYARNRTYSPGLGRWLQQDPNASGLPVNVAIFFHGISPVMPGIGVDIADRTSDGVALSLLGRSNPIRWSDPTGLFTTAGFAPLAPGMAAGIVIGAISGALDGSGNPNVGWLYGGVRGAATGAAFGAGFGAAGAMVSAYAGSGIGVLAGVLGRYAIPNFVGGAYASGTGQFMDGNGISISQMLQDAAVSAVFGSAIGSGAEALSRRFLVAAAGGAKSPLLGRYLSESGGRWGGQATRRLNHEIATELESQGYRIIGGAGRGPEEWIPGPGGRRLGGTFVDITATNGATTIRVQTVSTSRSGALTADEANAAARIRAAFPNDILRLVPK
jgi:hypothetical protein